LLCFAYFAVFDSYHLDIRRFFLSEIRCSIGTVSVILRDRFSRFAIFYAYRSIFLSNLIHFSMCWFISSNVTLYCLYLISFSSCFFSFSINRHQLRFIIVPTPYSLFFFFLYSSFHVQIFLFHRLRSILYLFIPRAFFARFYKPHSISIPKWYFPIFQFMSSNFVFRFSAPFLSPARFAKLNPHNSFIFQTALILLSFSTFLAAVLYCCFFFSCYSWYDIPRTICLQLLFANNISIIPISPISPFSNYLVFISNF